MADPRLNVMFRGMMNFKERDKETLYEFYKFLKSQAESEKQDSDDSE